MIAGGSRRPALHLSFGRSTGINLGDFSQTRHGDPDGEGGELYRGGNVHFGHSPATADDFLGQESSGRLRQLPGRIIHRVVVSNTGTKTYD